MNEKLCIALFTELDDIAERVEEQYIGIGTKITKENAIIIGMHIQNLMHGGK